MDERDDAPRTLGVDRIGQFIDEPHPVLLRRLVRQSTTVFVARRHVRHRNQQWRKLPAAPFIASHGECAQRVAVKALPARDEVLPLRLADLDEVLTPHLQRRLDRFGSARDEVRVAGPSRRAFDQQIRELLRNLGGEEARMHVGDAIDLRVHRGQHVGMRMAQAGDGGAARCVDVGASVRVRDHDTAGARGDGKRVLQLSVQDVAHRNPSVSVARSSLFRQFTQLTPHVLRHSDGALPRRLAGTPMQPTWSRPTTPRNCRADPRSHALRRLHHGGR